MPPFKQGSEDTSVSGSKQSPEKTLRDQKAQDSVLYSDLEKQIEEFSLDPKMVPSDLEVDFIRNDFPFERYGLQISFTSKDGKEVLLRYRTGATDKFYTHIIIDEHELGKLDVNFDDSVKKMISFAKVDIDHLIQKYLDGSDSVKFRNEISAAQTKDDFDNVIQLHRVLGTLSSFRRLPQLNTWEEVKDFYIKSTDKDIEEIKTKIRDTVTRVSETK